LRTRMIQKEKKPNVAIDGLEDFPLEVIGLTVDSVERSGGHIIIPLELVPFLKVCRMPAVTRKKKAREQYLLRVRRKRKLKRRTRD
jgi:hypothetical protein